MKLKNVYQLFLFIFLSNICIAQNDFYIEVTPNTSEIEFLESLEKLSEKNMDSISIFENTIAPLTRKEAKENLQIKQKNKHLKLPTYRIYFNSLSFDTLTILAFSRNYTEKVYTENNKNSAQQLWVVPIIVYKSIIEEKDYNKLSELLLKLMTHYYQEYDSTTNFSSVNFTINNSFNSLSSVFYGMVGPESILFEDPYNTESEIKDRRSTYEFIYNNEYVNHQNFPLPEKIHFSILNKIYQDPYVKPYKRNHLGKLTSNLKIIIKCDNIGFTYSKESIIKTFWTIKNNYSYDYVNEYKIFQKGMDFLFLSALYNSFKHD